MSLGEFQLIDRYFKRAPRRADVPLGVGDDCALLQVPAGHNLAVSIDTLVEDVHFPASTSAYDVGHKSLAVGLSDLAAMGAQPAWATLSLSLPEANEEWIQGFAEGFSNLLEAYGMDLVGGDTVRGPRVISVQVHGFVPEGQALRRDGARPGDLVCVSGCLGGAALGLRQVLAGERGVADAVRCLNRPQPRVGVGLRLRQTASACIDISDGLLADLGHVLKASGCGAEIEAGRLPLHPALSELARDEALDLALSGGDDYELVFTLPAGARSQLAAIGQSGDAPLAVIGQVVVEPGLRVRDDSGRVIASRRLGHDHFRGGDDG